MAPLLARTDAGGRRRCGAAGAPGGPGRCGRRGLRQRRARRAATQQGRASVDFLFIYAMEYAWAGATRRGARAAGPGAGRPFALLGRQPALWPREFPASMRDDPRYAALWRNDPKRQEIVASRLTGVTHGQMAGYLPDGRRVVPNLPPDLMARRA